ncbi:MAG: hypothetical protein ACRDTP_06385 [Mycobacteriales bacterium]
MYADRWIRCTDDAVVVRGYYFPWGAKHIPYDRIKKISRVAMTFSRGKGRVWGTASPTLWASFDPVRGNKSTALVLDLGRTVRPFLTPDDPEAFLADVRAHAPGVQVTGDAGRGPIV